MNRLPQQRMVSYGYTNTPQLTGNVDYIKGSGIFSTIKKKTLDVRPKILNDLLNREGDQIISKIEVCRKPITGLFEKILNVVTFGQLKRKMKEKGYDDLYHLYLIVHLGNGNDYSLEKNERVNVVKGRIKGECEQTMDYGKKTLRQFIEDTEKLNISGFYRYNSFSDNCQKWVFDILNANGITKFNSFVKQDVDELAPDYVKYIARGVTDIAGIADYIKRGGGL